MSQITRFTAGAKNSPLTDVVMRCLQETGGLTVGGLRTPGFRALAPLIEKAQVIIDKAVVKVGLQRLTFVKDILDAGLTYPLPDPLSVTQLEWYQSNKTGAAQRTMNPSARGENKLPILLPNRLPIYLTTDMFELDIRTLKMSQRVGMPLDTTLVETCTRSVNEALEDAAINGPTTLDGQTLTDFGYSAYGLMNAPHANTQTLTLAAWSTAPVGSTVFNETQLMIGKLQTALKYGPYRLYVGTAIGNALFADYNATNNAQGLTIAERLLKIPSLEAVRVADLMPVNKVALVQMTSDVIDIVTGQQPTVIPWTSLDGFTIYNLVMAIMVPRVRWDYNNNSGICIGTLQ